MPNRFTVTGISTAALNKWPKRYPIAADAIALIGGVALVAAFAPFGWRLLSFLIPAMLLYLWLESSTRQAFWRGYLFGLGYFSFGVSWVYNSIYEYGQAPAALAIFITLVFIGFLSLYPALTGSLANWFCALSKGVRLVLVYPIIWTLLEWSRSWVLTGFPWLLMGQAQVDTPLAGIIPIFGVLGGSWLNLLIAGLLVLSVISTGRNRWLALLSMVAILFAVILLGQIHWSAPSGDTLAVSMIQANIPQDTKLQSDQLQPTLALYRTITRAQMKDSGLIIWPETAVPTYFKRINATYLRPLADEAAQHNAELLIGTFVYDEKTARTYNSLVKPGAEVEIYHKRHLVPFGEYLPLRGVLMWMKDYIVIPMSDLSAGQSDKPLVQFKGYTTGVSICYEDAFGNEVIDALPEANLLINVSNDAWFGDSLAPHQHLEIARLRALESGRYLLRSTNTGISAVIDPSGAVTVQSPQFRTDVLTAEVVLLTGLTPYSRWGNWAVVTVLGGLLLVIVWLNQNSRRDRLLSPDN